MNKLPVDLWVWAPPRCSRDGSDLPPEPPPAPAAAGTAAAAAIARLRPGESVELQPSYEHDGAGGGEAAEAAHVWVRIAAIKFCITSGL